MQAVVKVKIPLITQDYDEEIKRKVKALALCLNKKSALCALFEVSTHSPEIKRFCAVYQTQVEVFQKDSEAMKWIEKRSGQKLNFDESPMKIKYFTPLKKNREVYNYFREKKYSRITIDQAGLSARAINAAIDKQQVPPGHIAIFEIFAKESLQFFVVVDVDARDRIVMRSQQQINDWFSTECARYVDKKVFNPAAD